VSEHQVFDLENNLPVQTIEFNSFKTGGVKFKDINSRKIYSDESRMLNLQIPKVLNFPMNRITLLKWKNIAEMGANVETVMSNTSLVHFSYMYRGQSMFHHFFINNRMI